MSGLVTGEIRAYEGTRVHTYIVHIYVLAEMGACALNKVVHTLVRILYLHSGLGGQGISAISLLL